MNPCPHDTVGAPQVVTMCECHVYRFGDKKLTSVSSVIKSIFPVSYEGVEPEVLENAADRGRVCDSLFCAYIEGKLDTIEAGTRQDSVDLFFKLKTFWDAKPHGNARTQCVVFDSDIAGTLDIWCDGWIYDIKCTVEIMPTAPIQVGLYAQLWAKSAGEPVKGLGILHTTKRYPGARFIEVPMAEALQDALTTRSAWEMLRRRKAKNAA